MAGMKSKEYENTGFTCRNCSNEVLPLENGSYRNHCPFCLYSLHVDVEPGDRASDCFGLMEPVSVAYNTQKGWQILHRCVKCCFTRNNIVAEDGRQPDDFGLILKLSAN